MEHIRQANTTGGKLDILLMLHANGSTCLGHICMEQWLIIHIRSPATANVSPGRPKSVCMGQ